MQLQKGKYKVLVIPDLQIPFHHKDAFSFLKEVKKKVQPNKVVCIGDSIDAHALSEYLPNPSGMSAGDEHKLTMKYMKELYKIFPNVIEVESNHNSRVFRRAYKSGIPEEFLKSYAEFLEAPKGWKFIKKVEIDGVKYEHGHAHGGRYAARYAVERNMKSTVIGHHHSNGGIHYIANEDRMLFGMNVGCLIDEASYAFEYQRDNVWKPTLGCGIVNKGVPKFVPMIIDNNGNWTGDIIV